MWVLIVIIVGASPLAGITTGIEFKSQATCEMAKKQIAINQVKAVCVQK